MDLQDNPIPIVNTTGAALAPELISRVLDFFAEPHLTSHVVINKRQLGVLCLVCRHWASRCRIHLFRLLELRTRKDVDVMLEFLRGPPIVGIPPITKLVKQIHATIPLVPQIPWIHLIEILLVHRIPDLEGLYITLKGGQLTSKPFGPGQQESSFATLPHHALPVNIPIKHAQTLTLVDCHLQSFAALLRLCGYIPGTRALRCINVTWPLNDEISTAFVQNAAARSSVREIRCKDCGHAWQLSWLVSRAIDSSEWPIIHELIHITQAGFDKSNARQIYHDFRLVDDKSTANRLYMSSRFSTDHMDNVTGTSLFHNIIAALPQQASDAPPVYRTIFSLECVIVKKHVTSVALFTDEFASFVSEGKHVDWNIFDQTTLTLPWLHSVYFRNPVPWEAKHAMHELPQTPLFPGLSASGKLKFQHARFKDVRGVSYPTSWETVHEVPTVRDYAEKGAASADSIVR